MSCSFFFFSFSRFLGLRRRFIAIACCAMTTPGVVVFSHQGFHLIGSLGQSAARSGNISPLREARATGEPTTSWLSLHLLCPFPLLKTLLDYFHLSPPALVSLFTSSSNTELHFIDFPVSDLLSTRLLDPRRFSRSFTILTLRPVARLVTPVKMPAPVATNFW